MNRTDNGNTQGSAIGAEVLKFRNNSPNNPSVTIRNNDPTISLSIEWRDSDDGTTWTTISGTSATITPGNSDTQLVNSTKRLIALFAVCNVSLDYHVARQYNLSGALIDLDL